MSTATIPGTTLPPEVRDFLQRHQAEAAFDKVRESVRECFADLREMTFWLQDDPDGEDRAWCVIGIRLPGHVPAEDRLDQLHHYHERVVAEVPFAQAQLFGVWAGASPPITTWRLKWIKRRPSVLFGKPNASSGWVFLLFDLFHRDFLCRRRPNRTIATDSG